MNYRILPPDELIETRITPPPSKSISNRALILRALSGGKGSIHNIAECDDTRVLIEALSQGKNAREVNIGAAGTAMRFLTAYYAATEGCEVILDGSERMRNRPIGELVDALRSLGASIDYVGDEGYPPLHIRGHRLSGGETSIRANVSSQFVSALLMIAPTMKETLTLHLDGEIASKPYITMTLGLMEKYGVKSDFYDGTITIAPQSYSPTELTVEADWSAAAFWMEIAAISCGFITLEGISADSIQGDAPAAIGLFSRLGIDTEPGEESRLDLVPTPDQTPRLVSDMTDCPDLAQAVIVACATIGIPFRISGLKSLRIKETDRIEALRNELMKIGVPVTVEANDVMEWEGKRLPVTEMPNFDTYDDHRMAMAFAPVSIYVPGIIINNAEVVSKSYPGYWDDLRNAGFSVLDASEPYEEIAAEEAAED